MTDATLFEQASAATGGAGFARTKNPAAVTAILREHIARRDGAELEAKLLAAGVPVSRVATLPEFLASAESAGLLDVVALSDNGVTVRTPGLGFRVTTAAGSATP